MALVRQILEFKTEMAKYLQEVPGQNILKRFLKILSFVLLGLQPNLAKSSCGWSPAWYNIKFAKKKKKKKKNPNLNKVCKKVIICQNK